MYSTLTVQLSRTAFRRPEKKKEEEEEEEKEMVILSSAGACRWTAAALPLHWCCCP